MRASDLAQLGKRRLSKARVQCADPLLQMKQILEYVLEVDAAQLALRWDEPISDDVHRQVEKIIARREAGEPFQYIVGYEWFWNSKFKVGSGVFIPRKETEILVETILDRIPRGQVKVAELGAGSGNIGISILEERLGWEWHAFESNPKSLPYLEYNRKLLPKAAVYLVHAKDFFENARELAPFDGIVSNPPYIKESEMQVLPVEVKKEPAEALRAGPKGLACLKQLVRDARHLLRPGGFWAIEMDYRQKDELLEILAQHGFLDIEVIDDYAHRPRVVFARFGSSN